MIGENKKEGVWRRRGGAAREEATSSSSLNSPLVEVILISSTSFGLSQFHGRHSDSPFYRFCEMDPSSFIYLFFVVFVLFFRKYRS